MSSQLLRGGQHDAESVVFDLFEYHVREAQVLVAAKHLVDGDRICIVPCDTVEYWHLLFDGHQIIFAEASPVESLLPGRQSLDAVTPIERDEIVALFPELERNDHDHHLSRYTLRRFEAQALRLYA